ncbi:hypothetical protein KAFR_0H02150 [Kazachstania africana CBS 2517]|uniref:Diphthine--ammonia ligase n=1 Tax=Kazachstania africana (strain ATCC 22294 / BCRC 22015 / CBS 2517 / CECT 1963 / NBRC 1671 / NRRL Y-8276) TaxID=1071382 RepID=H2AZ68_KAZAF|nr:hypothetical protein KAFR_0H02150 [Kazachstania africana CBS 2517]CCF59624.1 hypothetical protein KAFR_0H02150 [Kazachstania africana CBS 2517]
MKFVALVSGGKDSFFNILHCLKQGHELIALGNLYPSENEQEIDSFMFQTVGFDIVSYYSSCISKTIAIHRWPIVKNTSKNVKLNYTQTQDDEIEQLFEFLKNLQFKYPELEAVSVGAILSSYQRNRVENVCNRLGLSVLSYLWQRNQLELMTEMAFMSKSGDETGRLDARIIKVAAEGLNESHLGKSLPEILPIMIRLNQMYDVHICGEGGEFETMVLDAPFFDRGYLKLKSTESYDNGNNNDGVFNARLNVEFVERSLPDGFLQNQLDKIPQPPLLSEKWHELINRLGDAELLPGMKSISYFNDFYMTYSVVKVDNLLYVSNLRPNKNFETVESQATDIFEQLFMVLNEYKLSQSQILSSSLILSNMSNFGTVNKIYNEFFNISKWGPLPPSRSCVGSNLLGDNVQLQLSVVIDINCELAQHDQNIQINHKKDGLHVQGRSYWAPCNIGPYSQAIWYKKDQNQVSYISGQIALIPQSMEMVGREEPILQSALSLRHFDTLKQAINATEQLFMTCYITDMKLVDIVRNMWILYAKKMSEESELWFEKTDDPVSLLVIVKVSQLPRDALCEWGGITCKKSIVSNEYEDYENDEEDKIDTDTRETEVLLNSLLEQFTLKHDAIVSNKTKKRHFTTVFTNSAVDLQEVLEKIKGKGHITLYFTPSGDNKLYESFESYRESIEFYPVEQVFDYTGESYSFALQLKL